jgi:hypothetical protein
MLKILFVLCFSSCAYRGNPKIKLPEGETHLTISVGRVHKSCLDKFGGKFLTLLDLGMKEGMKCIKQINGEGSKKNRLLLEKLFSSKAITFNCNEKDYFKTSNLSAHASIDTTWNKASLDLIHPYVSINPDYVLSDSEVTGEVTDFEFMKVVLFHEYFHNLGFAHSRTVDYAYACEECCFSFNDVKEKACKVCSTNYSSMSDPRYVKDLLDWGRKSSFKKSIGVEYAFRNALFKKPGSAENLKTFLDDLPSSIAVITAKKLKDLAILEHGKSNENYYDSDPFYKIVQRASDAQIELYVRGSLSKAVKIYYEIDEIPFRDRLKSKTVKDIWDDLLYDMDFVLMILKDSKRMTEYNKLEKKYYEIYNLLPKA